LQGQALARYSLLPCAFVVSKKRAASVAFSAIRKKQAERPKTDMDKHDQWMVRMSRAVGRDLGPFFEKWGVPTSEKARASIGGLPPWMPGD